MKTYKETRVILSDMLNASPRRMKGYVFIISRDFIYPFKTFKRIKVFKMEIMPSYTIHYLPNPFM